MKAKKNIKAMVMAAGMGTRLEPITLNLPKPLIPIMNKPLMDIILSNLNSIGVKDVISNTYYMADKIIERYKTNEFGINFNYIKEEILSGTAGGVKKCQFFFDEGEDFIVISGDILTNADIKRGIDIHKKSGAIATIGVKEISKEMVSNFGVVVTDLSDYVISFQEKPRVEDARSNLINTGIYIFNYKIFDYIPEGKFYDFAKDVFPKLLKDRQINVFRIKEYWNDIGTLEQYKQSIQDVFDGKCAIGEIEVTKTSEGNYVNGGTKLPRSIKFIGSSVIGNNCILGEDITLDNCIIFDNTELKSGTRYTDKILIPSKIAEKDMIKRENLVKL